MKARTIIFCINGINADPRDRHGWTDEFVTSLNIRTSDSVQVEKFEYFSDAIFRRLRQKERAEDLLEKVKAYAASGYRVVLIGHSNGCDIIARVLAEKQEVDCIHLFAPAANVSDFEWAIEKKLVRRIHIYGSPDDLALKAASFTGVFLKIFGLGYGSLGLDGKTFADKYPDIVEDHSIKGYHHSTWFLKGPHYDYTINLLINNEQKDFQGYIKKSLVEVSVDVGALSI